MRTRPYTLKTKVMWTLIITLLALAQFPGVLFFHDVAEPRIFGMPFIYGYIIIIWALLCGVLLWAYLAHWGRPTPAGTTTDDTQKGVDR
ncbi:hypothetical protein Q7C18_12530 [Nesterenkonia sp. CL21]|uniref:hypothetical protein n=1 Tax=Nesterenkonia sp. CL21 TaxID=3064894 RepID=UPI002878D2D3|nr:hypothetical protein [Nesterenkonia sp. CL21]MDS2173528.1 hypothetical protein [Nesterenkonia sp. CL21]